jgi:hypothetical protein
MKKIFVYMTLFCLCLNLSAKENSKKIELKDIGLFSPYVPEDDFTNEIAEKRVEMLEEHKKYGHMTMGFMLASFASALWGVHKIDDARDKRGGKSENDAKRLDIHMGLSLLTMASYFTTAYYGMAAPKPREMQNSSARMWHKELAWIHGTAMVLAPILGFLAFQDYHDGKDPEGIAKLHKPIMMAGFAAFAASYSIAVYNW